jgi:hypothetical protein
MKRTPYLVLAFAFAVAAGWVAGTVRPISLFKGAPPLDPTDRKYVHAAIFIRGNGHSPAPPPPVKRVF